MKGIETIFISQLTAQKTTITGDEFLIIDDGLKQHFKVEINDLFAGSGVPEGDVNEIQTKLSATQFQGGGVFINSEGNLTLGGAALAGTSRTIDPDGSEIDIELILQGKGAGALRLGSPGNPVNVDGNLILPALNPAIAGSIVFQESADNSVTALGLSSDFTINAGVLNLTNPIIPGKDNFIELDDTPSSYAGSNSYKVVVNAGATGLEFVPDVGGGGATQFIDLTDTPGTYAGQAGDLVRVNATEDGLIFFEESEIEVNFTGLQDTPGTYAGAGGQTLRVTGAEDAVEFVTPVDFWNRVGTSTLTGNTVINTGNIANSLTFSTPSTTIFQIGGDNIIFTPDDFKVTAGDTDFQMNNSQAIFTDSRVTKLGIQYAADYSSDLTSLSLIHRGYVDNHVGGQTLSSLAQNPTATEDGYDLAWDNSAQEYTLQPPGAVTAFINLTDTPASYAGQGQKALAVNIAEDAVEFIDFPVGASPAGTVEGAVQYRNAAGDSFNAFNRFNYSDTDNTLIILDTDVIDPNLAIGIQNLAFGSGHDFTNTAVSQIEHSLTGGLNLSLDNTLAPGQGFGYNIFLGRDNSAKMDTGSFGINGSIMAGLENTAEQIGGGNFWGWSMFGRQNKVSRNFAHASGWGAHATGAGAFAHGTSDPDTGYEPLLAAGTVSVNISTNTVNQTVGHGALAAASVILGGLDHNIPSGGTFSVILGGEQIKATADPYFVYMPKVKIGQGLNAALTQNDLETRILVHDLTTGEIKWRDASTLGGGGGGLTGSLNGLSDDGFIVKLGGAPLAENTTIAGGGFDFTLGGSADLDNLSSFNVLSQDALIETYGANNTITTALKISARTNVGPVAVGHGIAFDALAETANGADTYQAWSLNSVATDITIGAENHNFHIDVMEDGTLSRRLSFQDEATYSEKAFRFRNVTAPTTNSPDYGWIYVDITDDNLYFRKSDGDIKQLNTTPSTIDEFTELTDTPSSYAGFGLDLVRVNLTEDALEFIDVTGLPFWNSIGATSLTGVITVQGDDTNSISINTGSAFGAGLSMDGDLNSGTFSIFGEAGAKSMTIDSQGFSFDAYTGTFGTNPSTKVLQAPDQWTMSATNLLTESTQLTIQDNLIQVLSDVPTFPGVQYFADYSANYTARSLVDRGFVQGFSAIVYSDNFTEMPVLNPVRSVKAQGVKGDGQVTLTNGSATITGVGSNFTDSSPEGMSFWFNLWVYDGANYYRILVQSITNDTSATMSKVYDRADVRTGYAQDSGAVWPGLTGTFDYWIVDNIAEGNYAQAFGNQSYADNFAFAYGGSVIASGQTSFTTGFGNISSGSQAFSGGSRTNAVGEQSFAFGDGDSGSDKEVFVSGDGSVGLYSTTSGQTAGHGVLGDNSAAIGGINHNIPVSSLRSVILGGNAIKADGTVSDMVYAPNLRLEGVLINNATEDRYAVINSTTNQIEFRTPGQSPFWKTTGTTNAVDAFIDAGASGSAGLTINATDSSNGSSEYFFGMNYTTFDAGSAYLDIYADEFSGYFTMRGSIAGGIYSDIYGDNFGMSITYRNPAIMGINMNDTAFTIADAINSKGLEYTGDYTANFTTRSLIDKGYADGNYWNLSGTSTLGTGATQLTLPTGTGDSLTFQKGLSSIIYDTPASGFHRFSITLIDLLFTKAPQLILDANATNQVTLGTLGQQVNMDDVAGMFYAADYSATFTARSLVDKAYVDSMAAAFQADAFTQITPVIPIVLAQETGDEKALDLSMTVNKLTSGRYNVIFVNVTDTASPAATNYLIEMQVGSVSRFRVTDSGDIFTGGDLIMGSALAGTNRIIEATGSAADVNLTLRSKGASKISFEVAATEEIYVNASGLFVANAGAGADPFFSSNNALQLLSLTGALNISSTLNVAGNLTASSGLTVTANGINLGNAAATAANQTIQIVANAGNADLILTPYGTGSVSITGGSLTTAAAALLLAAGADLQFFNADHQLQEGTVSTAAATATTVDTIPVPASKTIMIEVKIIGGESDATPTENAGYVMRGVFRRIGAAAPTILGTVKREIIFESTTGMNVTFLISGNNVLAQVTGVTATNINWTCETRIVSVDSN